LTIRSERNQQSTHDVYLGFVHLYFSNSKRSDPAGEQESGGAAL